jgi:hypothetical protein
LKEALGLSIYATEAEFQEARGELLLKIFNLNLDNMNMTEAQASQMKRFPKAYITDILQMPSNSSKEDLEKGFKYNLKLQNPHENEEKLNLVCTIILAYPMDHPFDHPGRTLGESSQLS